MRCVCEKKRKVRVKLADGKERTIQHMMMTPLLRLKYGAIQDAVADLGTPDQIGKVFAGFQRYLYTEKLG